MAEYDAFISYAHQDVGAAANLQRSLQRFARPWYRALALQVFRDESHLPATASLSEAVMEALDESKNLIVVASPAAAASDWVRREIDHWLTRHRPDSILIARASGIIDWKSEAHAADNALPDALRAGLDQEPLYVDLAQGRRQTLEDDAYRRAVAQLAAAIGGVSLDALLGEHLRQQRRTRTTIGGVVVLVATLVVGVMLSLSRAREEADARQVQETAKVAREREARSRELAASSRNALVSHRDTRALALALAAHEVSPTREAFRAWIDALSSSRHLIAELPVSDKPIQAVGLHGSGTLIALETDAVHFWDWKQRSHRATRRQIHPDGGSAVAVAASGAIAATGSSGSGFVLWDTREGSAIHTVRDASAFSLAFDAQATRLIVGGSGSTSSDSMLEIWNIAERRRTHARAREGAYTITDIAVDAAGRGIATGSLVGAVGLWRLDLAGVRPIDPEPSTGLFVDIRKDGKELLIAGADAGMTWDIAANERYGDPFRIEGLISGSAYVEGGPEILFGSEHQLTRRMFESRLFGVQASPIQSLARDPTGALFATGSRNGRVRVWRSRPQHPWQRTLRLPELTPRIVAMNSTGTVLAIGADDNRMVGFGERKATGASVWLADTATGRLLGPGRAAHAGAIQDLVVSASGDLIASAGMDGQVRLWTDGSEPRTLFTSKAANPILDIELDESRQRLAVATKSEPARIVALADGRVLWSSARSDIRAVTFASAGALLLGSADGTLLRREGTQHQASKLTSLPGGEMIHELAFAQGGKRLVVLAEGGAHVLDTAKWSARASGVLHHETLRQYAGAGVRGVTINNAGRVELWDLSSTEPLAVLNDGSKHSVSVMRTGVAAALDGRLVAATIDGHVALFDLRQTAMVERTCSLIDDASGTDLQSVRARCAHAAGPPRSNL